VPVTVIQARGVSRNTLKLGHQYFVTVTAGNGMEKKTKSVKGKTLYWNEDIVVYVVVVHPI
jgi:hypothetical protein